MANGKSIFVSSCFKSTLSVYFWYLAICITSLIHQVTGKIGPLILIPKRDAMGQLSLFHPEARL